MRVLVTGKNGQVGNSLVSELLKFSQKKKEFQSFRKQANRHIDNYIKEKKNASNLPTKKFSIR